MLLEFRDYTFNGLFLYSGLFFLTTFQNGARAQSCPVTPTDKTLRYLQVLPEMTEEFRVLGIKAEFSESLWAWLLTSYAE